MKLETITMGTNQLYKVTTIQRKNGVMRYQLPYTKRHQQYAPRHEVLLSLQIWSHVQSETQIQSQMPTIKRPQ